MIDLYNVTVDIKKRVLLSVDELHFEAGSFASIIGPNGAGKSTLLKAIAGDTRHQGRISFHQKALSDWQQLDRARHLAVLPQSSQLAFPFSAEEVVALGLIPLCISHKEGLAKIQHEMRTTDCLHLAKRAYPSLSGGEQQRVQLARVLLQLSQAEHAPCLLLDEPTSAQDIAQQHMLLELARKLSQEKGYTVIAILHDLNHVLRYCSHCVVLNDGRIQTQGRPVDCITRETIAAHWHYDARIIHPQNYHTSVVL